jgi:hypothetical protein
MIIIIIEQVDQQDRSTQSTDKARDKKKTQKKRKPTFSTRTEQLTFYCRSVMRGLTLPNSIDATTIITILN